jgi:hypothetical protein
MVMLGVASGASPGGSTGNNVGVFCNSPDPFLRI